MVWVRATLARKALRALYLIHLQSFASTSSQMWSFLRAAPVVAKGADVGAFLASGKLSMECCAAGARSAPPTPVHHSTRSSLLWFSCRELLRKRGSGGGPKGRGETRINATEVLPDRRPRYLTKGNLLESMVYGLQCLSQALQILEIQRYFSVIFYVKSLFCAHRGPPPGFRAPDF